MLFDEFQGKKVFIEARLCSGGGNDKRNISYESLLDRFEISGGKGMVVLKDVTYFMEANVS